MLPLRGAPLQTKHQRQLKPAPTPPESPQRHGQLSPRSRDTDARELTSLCLRWMTTSGEPDRFQESVGDTSREMRWLLADSRQSLYSAASAILGKRRVTRHQQSGSGRPVSSAWSPRTFHVSSMWNSMWALCGFRVALALLFPHPERVHRPGGLWPCAQGCAQAVCTSGQPSAQPDVSPGCLLSKLGDHSGAVMGSLR